MEPSASRRRERRIAIIAAIALVLGRSFVFTWWEQAAFDSDQAIIGLMALHISQLRAFPVFMYGFNYLLAIEGYLAAPVFAIFGPSVAALRAPLIAVNIAVAVLLIIRLERDVGLRPALGFIASLFFILAAPGTASQLVEANGGNLEPFLYVLLLWLTWDRPLLFGAILGFGFLHREFTVYGLTALVLLDGLAGRLFTKERAGALGLAALSCVAAWAIVYGLRPWSDAAGPGAGPQWIGGPSSNLETLAERFCWAPGTLLRGLRELFVSYLAFPFGAAPTPLVDFGINSTLSEGLPWLWAVLGLTLLAAGARVVTAGSQLWKGNLRFCAYLSLIALQSAIFYVITRCGELSILNMRYTLLTLLGGVGIAGAFLRVERAAVLRALVIGVIVVWGVVSGAHHVRLVDEYVRRTPPNYRRPVVDYLVSHGIKYARADYWTAYHVTFLAIERTIVSANSSPRILQYEWDVDEHSNEAILVSRTPCPGGTPIIPDVYYACELK